MTFQDQNITGPSYQDETLRQARRVDLGMSSSSEQTLRTLGHSVGNIMREYPGPSLMIGAGLAWMLVSREQKKSVPLPQRLRDKATHGKEQLLERAHDVKEQTRESFEEAKLSTAERMSGVRQSAKQGLEHARESLHQRAENARGAYDLMLDDHPLILGAVAVAFGLAIGLMLPATEKEDQVMGPTRDSLLDQARTIVDDARKAAVETLRAGADSVKAHLSDAAEEAKATLEDSVQSAKEAVKEKGEETNLSSDSFTSGQATESF